MNNIINYITGSAMIVYLIGMVLVVILAAIFVMSLYFYMKAKDLAPYIYKIEELSHKILELEGKISDKEKELKEKTDEIAQANLLISEAKLKKEEMDNNKAEYEETKLNVEKARLDLQREKDLKDDLDKQVTEKRKELASLEQNAIDSDNKVKEAKSQKEDLDRVISEKTKEINTLDKNIKQKKLDINELNEQFDKVNVDLSKSKDELSKIEAKKEIEKERLKNLQNNYKDKEGEYIDKLNELKNDCKEKQKEFDKIRGNIEEGKMIISRSDRIKVNTDNMWNDLERPVAKINSKQLNYKSLVNEKIALAEFKENLENSGFKFHERTIYAFHTGLLCGNVSPLVVLAGVSGTGKSLLPELYSNQFGMNFLPVAVQPRWDGPQDIFGFYNHMEERFKATELSRLLWQFDKFNNKNIEFTTDEEMPMNIVLLDEMNLARVEYYFSELLSKLEMRRNVVNKSNDSERFVAEIELEYGAPSGENSNIELGRRIFIDNNILFVGTMNEDESTQTLSSKVIDRSNVLRFGTPESLKKNPDKSVFLKRCNKFVSYKTWIQWATDKGDGDNKNGTIKGNDVGNILNELKSTLDSIDRGFGHRTEKSILTYINYYPGKKEHALADQIEMKILPKLNGCDKDIVKEKVKPVINDILDKINDIEVTKAFNETFDSESTFFSWKGVPR